jgi:RsiW-degrading membrane proteinase PrsW (M82 family)
LTTFDPGLLLPPREEEETYPYRRAWRSMAVESAIMLGIAAALFVAFDFLSVRLPESLRTPVNVGLALIPVALWLAFSWWPERSVIQPRPRLLTVMIVSGLAANAIGIPLINDFLKVDRWLPLSSAIARIVGYTFTVGIVQEMLKYLVIRYTVWPEQFRNRLDGVAYGAACAVGYATVLNLHFALSNPSTPDITANRIFSNLALHLVTSVVVGYGLAEVRFSQPSPFLMTLSIALAAFITGIVIPIRAGLVNASLSLDNTATNPLLNISATKPLQGLAFSLGLLVALSLTMSFLFGSADQREREAAVREV